MYYLSTITEYVEWEDDDIQLLCFHLHFMLLYMVIHAILHLHRMGSYKACFGTKEVPNGLCTRKNGRKNHLAVKPFPQSFPFYVVHNQTLGSLSN